MIVVKKRGRHKFLIRLLVMREASLGSLGLTFIDGVCGLVYLWWKEDVGYYPLKVMMVVAGEGGGDKW
ncbi:hypothetical protein NC653_004162 [Populus alba x Populus x berolinensis]|uniref:Transmembrane protein n=1 Tax=Populus alba x Populus x berolinensis TaxID=444605 RepID=A0AAD6RVF8_9ROSI|nr:hypothetical protein NC653_004162 [Populus alba x Populus x berolinensis]